MTSLNSLADQPSGSVQRLLQQSDVSCLPVSAPPQGKLMGKDKNVQRVEASSAAYFLFVLVNNRKWVGMCTAHSIDFAKCAHGATLQDAHMVPP